MVKMKQIKNIQEKIKWEKYLSKEFKDWNLVEFYTTYILSEEFLEMFFNQINWRYAIRTQQISEKFLEKHAGDFSDLDWKILSRYYPMSEGFIEKFKYKVCWNFISKYQKLSEAFMRKFDNKLNWFCISSAQVLTLNFIKKYNHKISWELISLYQELPESFIKQNLNKLKLSNILAKNKIKPFLSTEFLSKYAKGLSRFELIQISDIASKIQNEKYFEELFESEFKKKPSINI